MKKKKLSLRLLSFLMAAMMVFSAAYVAPEYSSTAIVAEAAAKTVSISKAKIKVASSVVYTGKTLKPAVKVTYGGKTLKEGKNYTVKYSNNKSIGVAKITVSGISKGGYTGRKTVTFQIVPGKVTGVKAASVASDSVTLKWSAVKGAGGYYVYTYNAKSKKYTKVATASKNTVTVKKLSGCKDYTFVVKAYKAVSKKTYASSSYSSSVKVFTPPAKVSGLAISSFNTSSATLKWSAVKGATGYYVYSYDAATKKYTKVATTSKNTVTVKKLSKGVEYVFVVKAYKTVGKKTYTGTYYSSALKVCTVPAVPVAKATPGKNSVALSWEAAVGAAGYEVFMVDTAADKYYSLGETSKLKYTASGLDKSTYSFAVRAYKLNGKKKVYSAISEVVEATVTEGVYKIDSVVKAFKNGNYQMSIMMKDEEMGDSEVTIAAKKNGDLAVKTLMKGFDIRFVYIKETNKTYLVVKLGLTNYVVNNVPQDDFNFSDISSSLALGDIAIENVKTRTEFIDGKRYDIDYSVDENGNTTEYYFLGNKLVKINNIDKNGKTEATEIKAFKTSPDSALYKVGPAKWTERLQWVNIDYSALESILGGA